MIFVNRQEAGFHLAQRLAHCPTVTQVKQDNLLVLSIPRGGTVIGDIVARVLGCHHDILIVKKIGFPGYEEFAIGAIVEDDTVLLNHKRIAHYDLSPEQVHRAIAVSRDKAKEYMNVFQHEKLPQVTDKTVILVDDGIATGETIKVAVHWLRAMNHRAQNVIIAVPVCSSELIAELTDLAEAVICLCVPTDFKAVGQYYQNFEQVSEEDVLNILCPHDD